MSAAQTLRVTELTAGYGGATALHGISFVAEGARVTGIVGPNGAGKSTLLKAISGIVSSSGEITFGDDRLSGSTPRAVARAGVVHVPEGRRMLRGLSVRENLRVGGLVGRQDEQQGLELVLSLFPELEKLLGKESSRLSGGEQQMVAIGRGLMGNPRLLMVDELSLGLAPQIVRRIGEALKSLSSERKLGVLVVDQSVEVLRKIVDSLVVIVNGRVALHTDDPTGSGADVINAYLGLPSGVVT
jgi:branched-chain amino acid transport system ATP-binding protein